MKTEIRILRVLLALCALVQLTYFVLGWSGILPPESFVQISPSNLSDAGRDALSAWQRGVGAMVGLPALLVLAYGLWSLQRALYNIERNALFSLETIAHVRAFAGAALLSTFLAIVEVPLRTLAFRFFLGMPEKRLAIGLTGTQLLLILVCALFYLIIRLMHEGRRLAEENEGFV